MKKILLIFGTTTGCTEELAGYVAEGVKKNPGVDIKVKNVKDTPPEEMLGYDLIIAGSSTWGEGELQKDFIPFCEKMKSLDLSGKKVAVFGPGDKNYQLFCEAVVILEKEFKSRGAEIIAKNFKVDGDVYYAKKDAQKWGQEIGSYSDSNK